MPTLPTLYTDIYQIVQKVTEVTLALSELSREENLDLVELTKIWATLPIEDKEGMTYLEVASECVLEVSNLVDKTHQDLPSNQRTALKLRVMGKLLALKAQQLV